MLEIIDKEGNKYKLAFIKGQYVIVELEKDAFGNPYWSTFINLNNGNCAPRDAIVTQLANYYYKDFKFDT